MNTLFEIRGIGYMFYVSQWMRSMFLFVVGARETCIQIEESNKRLNENKNMSFDLHKQFFFSYY